MSQEQANQFLVQGINAAKAGQKDQARQLFQNTLRLDPRNETAWLWMSSVARNNDERLFCLKNLLQINPQNEMAIKGLQALGVNPASLAQQQPAAATPGAPMAAASAPAVASGDIPAVDRDRLGSIMTSVDEFLRGYKPIPVLAQNLEMARKSGRLYGEAAAVRRRAMRTGMVAAAGLIALVVVAGILLSLLSGENNPINTIVENATLTPTFTRTFTPTATPGVTNTPSPDVGNLEPTATIPPDLPKGDIYGGTATPIYPQVQAIGSQYSDALALFGSGQYSEALPLFTEERQNQQLNCYPDIFYFEVLTLAELGGRRNFEAAQSVIEEYNGRENCQDQSTTLIDTATCYLNYKEGLATHNDALFEEARNWCTSALAELGNNPPIVLASTTLARIELINHNFDQAQAVIDLARESWRADVNVLLMRAQVDIARGDLTSALNFVAQALYVDPLSEEALRTRIQAYISVASQTEDRQQRIQLYGTAVLASDDYLLYYPGKAAGYVLKAKARYGEGNIDQAEELLARVIQIKNDLPESDAPFVEEAYTLRAQIYQDTGRYEAALEDIQVLLQTDPQNTQLIEQQGNLALILKRYPLALTTFNSLIESDVEGTHPDWRLKLIYLNTEVCIYEDGLECDYQTALDQLTDEFIQALPENLQFEAYAYRAHARYEVTQAIPEGEISRNERSRANQQALEDIEIALAQAQPPIYLYYRGLIQEALEEPQAALSAYNWIIYWSQFYNYPFIEAVQKRAEAITESTEESS